MVTLTSCRMPLVWSIDLLQFPDAGKIQPDGPLLVIKAVTRACNIGGDVGPLALARHGCKGEVALAQIIAPYCHSARPSIGHVDGYLMSDIDLSCGPPSGGCEMVTALLCHRSHSNVKQTFQFRGCLKDIRQMQHCPLHDVSLGHEAEGHEGSVISCECDTLPPCEKQH